MNKKPETLPDRMGKLVRVLTRQQRELVGFHAVADKQAPLLIVLHGLSGSLDTSFVFDFLDHPRLTACHVLSITSSGRGTIAMMRSGPDLSYYMTGAAFEQFEDCVPDLAAWVDYAATQTDGPIFLMGHSLGASKVAYYQYRTADPRVAGTVLASAPDLKGAFIALHGSERFVRFMHEAGELVEQGRGHHLMGEDCVIGLLRQRVSASTLLDRFGEDKPADTFDFYERDSKSAFVALRSLSVPVLSVFAEQGEIVGPAGVSHALHLLRHNAVKTPSFDSLLVSGNHWYKGAEDEVAAYLANWMASCV